MHFRPRQWKEAVTFHQSFRNGRIARTHAHAHMNVHTRTYTHMHGRSWIRMPPPPRNDVGKTDASGEAQDSCVDPLEGHCGVPVCSRKTSQQGPQSQRPSGAVQTRGRAE